MKIGIPRGRKTLGGFLRYLFGERFIEGSKTEIRQLLKSPRWKAL